MSHTATQPMSVAEVLEIQPSENSWINDGFTAVVLNITQSPPNAAKKNWKCLLGDTTNSAQINMTVWTAPRFAVGDRIDVLGQGIKRKEYRGAAEVGVGQKTEIHVLGHQVEAQSRPVARPTASDAGEARGHEAGPADAGAVKFHQAMSANALLYLHCLTYARKINTTLKAGDHPEMAPDHFQACVSTLFITADRAGLSVMPPAIGKAVEAAPAPAARREPPPSGGRSDPPRSATRPEPGPGGSVRNDNPDEDVPF